VSLVLDAGAFVAVERANRDVIALLKRESIARRVPMTHGAVIGQIWRGGAGRQSNVARLLPAVEVVPLDECLGRRAGVLLGNAGASDVVDAAVVLIAADGDMILTSDAGDLLPLAVAAAVHVDIVPVR
jgi:hypothetical protein